MLDLLDDNMWSEPFGIRHPGAESLQVPLCLLTAGSSSRPAPCTPPIACWTPSGCWPPWSARPRPLTSCATHVQVVVPVHRLGTPGQPQDVNAASLAEAGRAFWSFFPHAARQRLQQLGPRAEDAAGEDEATGLEDIPLALLSIRPAFETRTVVVQQSASRS